MRIERLLEEAEAAQLPGIEIGERPREDFEQAFHAQVSDLLDRAEEAGAQGILPEGMRFVPRHATYPTGEEDHKQRGVKRAVRFELPTESQDLTKQTTIVFLETETQQPDGSWASEPGANSCDIVTVLEAKADMTHPLHGYMALERSNWTRPAVNKKDIPFGGSLTDAVRTRAQMRSLMLGQEMVLTNMHTSLGELEAILPQSQNSAELNFTIEDEV